MDSLSQTATGKQCLYLASLISDRPTWATDMGLDAEKITTLSKTEASEWIGDALAVPPETDEQPQRPGAIRLDDLKPGSYWTLDGGVARVRRSKKGRRLYAETLDPR
jgi:hypothetical protein